MRWSCVDWQSSCVILRKRRRKTTINSLGGSVVVKVLCYKPEGRGFFALMSGWQCGSCKTHSYSVHDRHDNLLRPNRDSEVLDVALVCGRESHPSLLNLS
jgi:hypothetical protein